MVDRIFLSEVDDYLVGSEFVLGRFAGLTINLEMNCVVPLGFVDVVDGRFNLVFGGLFVVGNGQIGLGPCQMGFGRFKLLAFHKKPPFS